MVIQWYGQACFKIQSGEFVIVIDPFEKRIGLTPPRVKTDLLLITHDHYDHNNISSLSGEPFLITGPGEYEVKGAYVRGIPTFHDKSRGKERGMNTIYKIEVESLRLLHLGDFGEGEMRDETLDEVGEIDILMLPVGGVYTIDGKEAARIVKQVEPRFVIPMHYEIPQLTVKLDGPETFLKEMGASRARPEEKFTVKKKDVGDKEKVEIVMISRA